MNDNELKKAAENTPTDTDTETNYLLQGKNGERLRESIEQTKVTEKLLEEAREEINTEKIRSKEGRRTGEYRIGLDKALEIITQLNERK